MKLPRRWIHFRLAWLAASLLVVASASQAQFSTTGDKATIDTVYSENGRYRLTSTPFDRYFPSSRGTSKVHLVGQATPLYAVDRPFHERAGATFLSNDGRIVLSILNGFAREDSDNMRSVVVFRDGAVVARYTLSDVTGCDERDQRCSILYWNRDAVDYGRSGYGATFHKVFNEGVSEEERFLSDFPVFAAGDSAYLVDSRRMVHTFSLVDGSRIGNEPFEAAYPQLKRLARRTKTESTEFAIPPILTSPALADGGRMDVALGRVLSLKPEKRKDLSFRFYMVWVEGTLSRDGKFELEKLDIDKALDPGKVRAFFATARFDVSRIPRGCERWYFDYVIRNFRNPDKTAARRERQAELVADTINGVYIPRDLGECFVELDKRLGADTKARMLTLDRQAFGVEFHMGLGMGLRNGWGLWGGSRLKTYFTVRGVRDADDMSGIILGYYYDWLHGDHESWRTWEETWRTRFSVPPPPAPPPPPPPPKKR